MSFVHLRLHTAYSLLEGAVRVGDIPALCGDHMPAVAITDTGNLFGALEFSETLAHKGLQPIIGYTLAPPTRDSAGIGNAVAAVHADGHPGGHPGGLALLARNEPGYANLMKLASMAFLQPDGITMEALAERNDGLICLTGGPGGPVDRFVAAQNLRGAEAFLEKLKEMFGDRLYMELQRHGENGQALVEEGLLTLAWDHDIPLVATNEPYFVGRDDFTAHDALICIAEGVSVMDEKRRRLTPEHWFKPAEMMKELFSDLPEALENTEEIAIRCAMRPVPGKPILPTFPDAGGGGKEQEAEMLMSRAREGLEARLQTHAETSHPREEYRERLEYELRVIIEVGFPGYFLIVADIIGWAKEHDIPVGPGRGSGAGSVVAWALAITDLDPMRFGLLFERFLNPERISMPDFDIDFCPESRDRVIHRVCERYGHDRVAQIITFGTLQARAVLRDVGRVLGVPYGQVDRLCKMVPNNPANPVTLADAIRSEPRLAQARDEDENVARMLEISLKLEGLYRHASTHAAGVVIADRPLDELVPLYSDKKSEVPVTQFSMKWAEQAGLVKFDFLGLKTLTILKKSVQLVRRRGVEVNIGELPLDDEKTFAMLSHGDTLGVFQLESAGMRDALRQLRPDRFEDIIALVALYRPGPMENIPKYIRCKHGQETIDHLHPSLEALLEETFGVIIYQEQVMQIAGVLSGYSLGEADILRRAMGKKDRKGMRGEKQKFVSGAVAKGVEKAKAQRIFDLVDKFAGYGFNKSHAAAYALLAYQTAWFKVNHPVEFLAACMSLELNNTDKIALFRQEAARLGISVHLPCVNRSDETFDATDGAIVYAIAALRHVGRQAANHIVSERQDNGPFTSLFDFFRRISSRLVNRRAMESLIKAGAFDSLFDDRARILGGLDRLMGISSSAAADRDSSQENLFGGAEDAPEDPPLPKADTWTPLQRLANELEAVGFYLSGHPLDDHAGALQAASATPHGELSVRRPAKSRVAGIVMECRERKSQKGTPYAFIRLSDASGEFEMVVFADLLKESRSLLEAGRIIVADADIDWTGDEPRLKAASIRSLEKFANGAANGAAMAPSRPPPVSAVKIFIRDAAACERLKVRLAEAGKGQGRVSLVMTAAAGADQPPCRVEMLLPGGFALTPGICAALEAEDGVAAVRESAPLQNGPHPSIP